MSSKIPSLIPTIVFIGDTNVGKSHLINVLTNQEISIVSAIAGTTTDEVVKRYELLDVGPINIIDTAGLNDNSELGQLRINKTKKAIKRANLLIYVCDCTNIKLDDFHKITDDKLLVFNKIDLLNDEELHNLKQTYPQSLFVSVKQETTIKELTKHLKSLLIKKDKLLLDDIDLAYPNIVHVIPIDSEAPKGRLILPQMQLIRECLDTDIISVVLKESELADYLDHHHDIGLIVTDSQAFKIVSTINHQRFPLTSYSILQAHQKGDLAYFIESVAKINNLKDHAHILLMESCSHNASHEDIGRIKIPNMLKDLIKKDITFDFYMGHDFPEDLNKYDFIIHCGSCMLSAEILRKRINIAQKHHIPMTNYGIFIAYYTDILSESVNIFKK
ncbi:MAG: [FeFe] hydrogenase H-cluster maturation GTPase HydF [Bacilli bacterium]|nr:[FeFe] hydrogenase H-cluster maturation GTPase HydF [Bacilli bacterium]